MAVIRQYEYWDVSVIFLSVVLRHAKASMSLALALAVASRLWMAAAHYAAATCNE